MAIVLLAAGFAIYRDRHTMAVTLHRVGVWPVVASFMFGCLGVGAAYPQWYEVLDGLGVKLPKRFGARAFYISQLGKYIPGSVWPVLMQMEAGRSRGANRRTMLGANLITLVLSCSVGLVLACLLLPIYNAQALAHYWWALFALPFLLGLLHPRALPYVLDRAFAILRRPPLGERLGAGAEARAAGWSLLGWVAYGAHLTVLCVALGHGGLSALVLCVGGMALAFPLGVLFIPAPAGAGIRDLVLKLVLVAILDPGQALAVAVASRVILIACDLALAGIATAFGGRSLRSTPVEE
jgi:uncharacterized membrane protein YbhN (UPF0104 family)